MTPGLNGVLNGGVVPGSSSGNPSLFSATAASESSRAKGRGRTSEADLGQAQDTSAPKTKDKVGAVTSGGGWYTGLPGHCKIPDL